MGSGVVAGGGFTLRLAALLLVVANLGLPINELATYALLVASALLILTGLPYVEPRRWLAAVAFTATIVAAHLVWPMPRIDEGHNVFLPGASATQSLPVDLLRVFETQFDQRYPPDKRCADPARGRWLCIFRGRHFRAPSVLSRGHRHRFYRSRASAPRRHQ
jgi:hypothetical protein